MRRALPALLLLALVSCRGEMGAPCEEDGECRRGLLCADYDPYLGAEGAQCTRWCESSKDCDEGDFCDAGACAKGCKSDADCPEGTLCNGDGEFAACGRVCESEQECVAAGNWSCPVVGELCAP